MISPAPLAATANALRSGQLDLLTYMDEMCNRIDAAEPLIHALLPEPDRRQRLLSEAEALQKRFPDPVSRPPLYGILLGVKDIFHVDGFPTRAMRVVNSMSTSSTFLELHGNGRCQPREARKGDGAGMAASCSMSPPMAT